MAYQRYALVLDQAEGRLGSTAMCLLTLGVDALYANDLDEAALLALQEAENLGAVLVPANAKLQAIEAVLDRICTQLRAGSESLVLVGPDPGEEARRALVGMGVRWGIFDPFEESALRFVTTAVMAIAHPDDPRKDLRVPTDLPAIACMGRHRKEATVHNLSVTGAYLAAPHPFLEGSLLSIDIALPGAPLWAKAEVMSANTADKGVRGDVPEGMGIYFTQMADETRTRLRGFIREQVAHYEILEDDLPILKPDPQTPERDPKA